MKKDGVIPAGSQPLDKTQETTAPKESEQKTTQPEETKSEESDGKLLGKFKSPEELAASYSELEKVLGRQSAELNHLRNRVEESSAEPDEPPAPPEDFEQARADIEKLIDDGELSVSEGLTKLAAITKQETEYQLEAKFADFEQKREAKEQYNQFLNNNPEFLDYEEQGLLDAEMQKNPMHDKFSAFFAVKGKMEAQALYEKGKEEALKLAKGADGTRSVLAKPGGAAREPVQPQKGLSDSDKVSGMLAALAAARQ